MVRALQEIAGDFSEEAFDLIDPRRVRRREVHVEAGMLVQPVLHRWVLVRRVVVTDDVHVQVSGNGLVDLGQELLELGGAMPAAIR